MSKTYDIKIRNDMFPLYLFAFIAHSIMLLIFLRYRINIMVCFDIVSVLLYLLLMIFSSNPRRNVLHSFGVIICSAEVILHQVCAVICLGMEVSFQYFFIMLAVLVILQPKELISKKTKIIICITLSLLLIAVELYASAHAPIYILPVYVEQIMLVLITSVALFGIIAFSFNQWNISEHYRVQIEDLLKERNTQIFQMQEKIIQNFADIIEKRDGSTGGHIKRTSAYVEAIINALMESGKYPDILTPEYAKMVVSAAPLHDIGKISISDSILCKRGRLTDEEFRIMKTHSSIGGSMLEELLGDLESVEYVSLAMDISIYHHERWNGNGYPSNLKGEEIPLSARIMTVADVFDALTSVRVYKESYSIDKAYNIMVSESGKQFDPVIIDEFVRIRPRITEIYYNL